MTKGTLVWDEICGWPYATPYGMVAIAAPKKKKPRKPRTHRAKPDWLKTKKEKPDGPTDKRRSPRRRKLVVEAPAEVRQAAVLETPPQI